MVNSTTTELCVSFQALDDSLVEFEEDFDLRVSSDNPAIMFVEPNSVKITITNTDGKLSPLS